MLMLDGDLIVSQKTGMKDAEIELLTICRLDPNPSTNILRPKIRCQCQMLNLNQLTFTM